MIRARVENGKNGTAYVIHPSLPGGKVMAKNFRKARKMAEELDKLTGSARSNWGRRPRRA